MKHERNADKAMVGSPERKNHLEDLGVDGRIILKLFKKKYAVRMWDGYLAQVTVERRTVVKTRINPWVP
jgi:hypothetical protein